ncbi:MAG: hypothetical protein KAJ18_03280 [Candidatus Omnitrophica bacterium]|nr:hypothetical protein [Candidatus Omnitrophota bacterium]
MKAKKDAGLSLKKCQLFSEGFVLDKLSLFNSKFQKDIIDIKFKVKVLNEEIENGMYFHRLAFDASSMSANSCVISQNMEDIYKRVMDMTKRMVDKIDAVLES